eukprot:TRINITY_DN43200_c0_g1_i1.p1 TRINITY_DN43200_c0_g1~~TRINITY_DN43200_c0_g1_i1.p1  ORF type:complete len:137 (-),score=8.60 TRINITY_DN43200_c0_g1_i1:26-436(-)
MRRSRTSLCALSRAKSVQHCTMPETPVKISTSREPSPSTKQVSMDGRDLELPAVSKVDEHHGEGLAKAEIAAGSPYSCGSVGHGEQPPVVVIAGTPRPSISSTTYFSTTGARRRRRSSVGGSVVSGCGRRRWWVKG